jgi:hypothetical protein
MMRTLVMARGDGECGDGCWDDGGGGAFPQSNGDQACVLGIRKYGAVPPQVV